MKLIPRSRQNNLKTIPYRAARPLLRPYKGVPQKQTRPTYDAEVGNSNTEAKQS